MHIATQVAAKLVNKPGRLAGICSALAKEKVNVLALAVMDSGKHSTLRFISDDPEKTLRVLETLGTPHEENDVLVVELQNRPGALARVCERLGSEHINIDYAYCSAGRPSGKTIAVFRVSNPAKAQRVLGETTVNSDRRSTVRRPAHVGR
jgi:hypothetical protein